MQTFQVKVTFTGSTMIPVQANSADEAKAIAKRRWAEDEGECSMTLNAYEGVEAEIA
jgi:hypothetical protein